VSVRHSLFVTHKQLEEELEPIKDKIKNMATQDDINALTTSIQQVGTDLTNSVATVQNEINNLAQQNPQLDLSGVQNAVSALDEQAKAVSGLVPNEPAPVEPTPDQPTS
jgi:DNA anti-recombination protein RmuC